MTEDEIREIRRDIAEDLFGFDVDFAVVVLAEALRRIPAALALVPEGRQ